MVFVGCTGNPDAHCGEGGDQAPYVVVDTLPTAFAEKPFVTLDVDSERYFLTVPAVRAAGRTGTDWATAAASPHSAVPNSPKASTGAASTGDDLKVPFEEVYVASNASDTSGSINAKLSQGLHVVLSPGVYRLEGALLLNTENQVLLGLGFATLVSANGEPCVAVGDVSGVRVAGILFQAGPEPTDALLVVGTAASFPGDPNNPVVLSDVFARVGGPDGPNGVAQAESMVVVKCGHVVGDNLWLWRADHTAGGAPVTDGWFPVDHGLVVRQGADDVSMYGLACEHTLSDLAVWDGDRGKTYFYQSELPYDATQALFGDPGFVGYRVGANVTSHQGYGIGVYSYFRDFEVNVETGISAPESATFDSPFSVFLNGYGGIKHVLNDQGNATGLDAAGQAYVCN
mmetsp:Transcript_63589/g.127737  ORF Transcript_63589/g.127737 Transcript_63589/m.127737 type:complete len:400 (+) Transcript_63589:357-1556(+)